jgi:hypothetical protein
MESNSMVGISPAEDRNTKHALTINEQENRFKKHIHPFQVSAQTSNLKPQTKISNMNFKGIE